MPVRRDIVFSCILFIFIIPMVPCQTDCSSTQNESVCSEGLDSNETMDCTGDSSDVPCWNVSDSRNGSIQTTKNTTLNPKPIWIKYKDYIRFFTIAKTIIYAPNRVAVLFMENGTVFLFKQLSLLQLIKDNKERIKNSTNGTDQFCLDGLCIPYGERDISFMKTFGTMQLPDFLITPFAIAVSIYSILGLVGITGNALFLIGILTSKQLTNSTGVLICSMALSDIITLAFCLPTGILQYFFLNSFAFSRTLCGATFYFKYLSIFLSTVSMGTIAFDRYIAICVPLKAKVYCTVSRARVVVVVMFVLSVGICLPTAFSIHYYEENLDELSIRRCIQAWATELERRLFFGFYFTSVFVIPLVVMLPAFIKIAYVLWKSTVNAAKLQATSSSANDKSSKSDTLKSRIQVIRMLLVNLLLFVMCWGPLSVMEVLFIELIDIQSNELTFYLTSLGLANSFLNPVVYFTMSRAFRNIMISAAKRLCCCGRRLNRTPSSSGNSTKVTKTLSSGSSNSSKKENSGVPDSTGTTAQAGGAVGDVGSPS